jgi:Tfp pilus assembly protein PilO
MKQQLEFTAGYEKFKRYYRSLEPLMERPKNRLYTAAVFSFLAIALFGWYAIRPTVQTIIYLQRDITDKSALDKQMEEKITNLVEAQSEYEEAKKLLPVLDDAIPDTPDAIDAISQIKNLVATTNATLSSVRITDVALVPGVPQPKAKQPEKSEFLIALTVSGVYQEVESFIQSLVTMRRILTLEQINFVPVKETGGLSNPTGKIIKLTLQLKAYHK